MIIHYLKASWRSLRKGGLTSVITIVGLSIGLGSSLLIGLFVLDELDFDQHLQSKDRLYRVTSTYFKEGITYTSALTQGKTGPSLLANFPEVENVTRLVPPDEAFLFSKNIAFKEPIIFTDSSFTKVFSVNLLLGSKEKCLAKPSSIIISQSTALKLYGSQWRSMSIIGDIVSLDRRIPLTIEGVFQDFPEHTHFTSNLFASVPAGSEEWMGDGSSVYTYLLLNEHSSVDEFSQKVKLHSSDLMISAGTAHNELNLQPVTKIHLFSSLADEFATLGNIKNIYALLFVAGVLLVITVSNFINLYTAQSLKRLKEVGVRKVIGAVRRQLQFQFLLETSVITLIALMIAVLSVIMLLASFNELIGKNLSIAIFLRWDAASLITGIVLSIALLAGLYPSIYLSGTFVIKALKGTTSRERYSLGWRKGLVMLQFAISCIMIMLSIVAYRQMNLINNMSLGFDKENTIAIANPYMLGAGTSQDIIQFRNELLRIPGVDHVSITGYTPSQNRWGSQRITFPDHNEHSSYAHPATWLMVDEGFIETMGLTLLSGRNLTENHTNDAHSILVNEKAIVQYNLNKSGTPLGAELSVPDDEAGKIEHYTVVGVVKNFNFGSLHTAIQPVVMKVGYHRFEMAARLSPGFPKELTITKIQSAWKKHLPIVPFEYSYIKDRFDRLHQSDAIASQLFTTFCLLAIILSAFGLFSLVVYSVASRMKEVGVRKVLGASQTNIVTLLSRQFITITAISYLLALPVGWFLAHSWTDSFAYKAEISWDINLIAGAVLAAVILFTLAYQTIRASLTNPVDYLKED